MRVGAPAQEDAFVAKVPVTDTCGTGGDELGTFNISSMAALAAAACGLPVAKHGNRAVSSRSGAPTSTRPWGVPGEHQRAEAQALLERTSFAFLFAPSTTGQCATRLPPGKLWASRRS
jgi:anthranilate synthase/phosphoribosyltransferase